MSKPSFLKNLDFSFFTVWIIKSVCCFAARLTAAESTHGELETALVQQRELIAHLEADLLGLLTVSPGSRMDVMFLVSL